MDIYIIVPYSYLVILPCLPVSTIVPVPSPKIVTLIIPRCMCVHVCMMVIEVLQFMPRACCMLGSVLPLRCIPAISFYFLFDMGSLLDVQTGFELTVAQVSFELTILPS